LGVGVSVGGGLGEELAEVHVLEEEYVEVFIIYHMS
jgi:hypothetical protein